MGNVDNNNNNNNSNNETNFRFEQFKMDRNYFYQLCFISMVSTLGSSIAYPLDITKARLQVQGEMGMSIAADNVKPITTAAMQAQRGLIGITLEMVRQEGFASLFGGFRVTTLRCIVFNSLRMIFYDLLRIQMQDNLSTCIFQQPILCATLAGGLAGAGAQAFCTPLDKIKIQLQIEGKRRRDGQPERPRSMLKLMQQIYRTGGLKGLWIGNGASILRSVLITVGDITIYDYTKRTLLEYTRLPDATLLHFLSSTTSGCAAAVLSTPTDVIKTRLLNQPIDANGQGLVYKGAWHCLFKSVQEEGLSVMYKGFTPCWLRIGPYTIVFWVVYEKFKYLFKSF